MATKIIYHEAGLDGKAAAVIARSFYPGAELIGATFGRPVELGDVSEDTVIMLGFSLGLDEMKALSERAKKFIWIDHKSGSAAIADQIEKNLGFVKEGAGTCQLTWEFFHTDGKQVPLGIWLLARHTVWDLKDPRVEPYQYGARLFLGDIADPMWYGVIENTDASYNTIMAAGEIIVAYLDAEYEAYFKEYALPVKLVTEEDEYSVLSINRGHANAKIFGEVDWNQYDAVLTYALNRDSKWVCRLFSSKHDIDCDKIAAEYGGGGSKGSAGFIIETLPFIDTSIRQEVINADELASKPNITEAPVDQPQLVDNPVLSGSEALYAFVGLHILDEDKDSLVLNAKDYPRVAKAIRNFCEIQKLPDVRPHYQKHIVVQIPDEDKGPKTAKKKKEVLPDAPAPVTVVKDRGAKNMAVDRKEKAKKKTIIEKATKPNTAPKGDEDGKKSKASPKTTAKPTKVKRK